MFLDLPKFDLIEMFQFPQLAFPDQLMDVTVLIVFVLIFCCFDVGFLQKLDCVSDTHAVAAGIFP